jgi:hypothetical protein
MMKNHRAFHSSPLFLMGRFGGPSFIDQWMQGKKGSETGWKNAGNRILRMICLRFRDLFGFART